MPRGSHYGDANKIWNKETGVFPLIFCLVWCHTSHLNSHQGILQKSNRSTTALSSKIN